jgi:hypothetical protein
MYFASDVYGERTSTDTALGATEINVQWANGYTKTSETVLAPCRNQQTVSVLLMALKHALYHCTHPALFLWLSVYWFDETLRFRQMEVDIKLFGMSSYAPYRLFG